MPMPFIAFNSTSLKRRLIPTATAALLIVAALASSSIFAQSLDLNSPTPVVSNEINGSILPLDIGDSRATRFYYIFNGLQGDLELTVESNNLDGDIDIFLAGNLRPLTKVTLYAGASASRAAKTVYLRREEPLILRVQARTPNDAQGTYRIRLGGAFKPATRLAGDAATVAPIDETANANASPARSTDRKVKRVSSVGARIEEPVVEVAKEEPKKEEEKAAPPVTARRNTPAPRPARTRTPPRRTSRTEAARKTPAKTDTGDTGDAEKDESSKSDNAKDRDTKTVEGNDSDASEKTATPKPEPKRPVRVPRARNSRNTTARRTDAPTQPSPDAVSVPSTPAENAEPAEARGVRLVLVMRDGERFVRDMSSVRRLTVERGMLVIVSKNGTVERQPMSSLLRMSIEP